MKGKRKQATRRANAKRSVRRSPLRGKKFRSVVKVASAQPLKNPRKTSSVQRWGDFSLRLPTMSSHPEHGPRDMHVLVSATGRGWIVRKSGAARGIGTFHTREEAIAHARDLAKDSNTQLYIHRQDGRVSDVHSYVKEGKGNYK